MNKCRAIKKENEENKIMGQLIKRYLLSLELVFGRAELPLIRDVIPLMRVGAELEFDKSYVELSLSSNKADATGNGFSEFGISEPGLTSAAKSKSVKIRSKYCLNF